MTTINDLKIALKGGLRKSKYMIEVSKQGLDSALFNCLCTSASVPERSIQPVTVSRFGHKYNMRGEVEYGGDTFQVEVLDNSNLDIRRFFDSWFEELDNHRTIGRGNFGGDDSDTGLGKIGKAIKGIRDLADEVKYTAQNISQLPGMALSKLNVKGLELNKLNNALYQVDIKIWQLDHKGDKVYGYVFHNAFPSNIGSIEYSDSEVDSLLTYPITFTFSTYDPVEANFGDNFSIGDIFGV